MVPKCDTPKWLCDSLWKESEYGEGILISPLNVATQNTFEVSVVADWSSYRSLVDRKVFNGFYGDRCLGLVKLGQGGGNEGGGKGSGSMSMGVIGDGWIARWVGWQASDQKGGITFKQRERK